MSCIYGIDEVDVRANNGQPSELFNTLLDYYGNVDKAYKQYLHVYSNRFKDFYGDWEKESDLLVDKNGEPLPVFNNGKEFITENVNKSSPHFIKNYNKTDTGYKVDKGNDVYSFPLVGDLSPTEQEQDTLSVGIDSKYFIDGLSAVKQNIIVRRIALDINEKVVNEGTVNKKEIFKKWKTQLSNARSAFEAQGSQVLARDAGVFLDNWSKIENQVTLYLSQLDTLDIKDIDGNSIKESSEFTVSEISETENWNDDAAFTKDSRTQLSRRLKRFLTSIPDRNVDGTVKRRYMGQMEIVPFDTVYNTAMELLSGTTNSFDQKIKTLEEYEESIPFVSSLIEALEDAPEDIKNGFTSITTKHHLKMKMLYFIDNENAPSFTVIDVNENSIAEAHIRDWKNNLLMSDGIILSDGNNQVRDDLYEDITKFYKERIVGQRKVPKIDEVYDKILYPLGFELSNRALDDISRNGVDGTNYASIFAAGNLIPTIIDNLNRNREIDIADTKLYNDRRIKQLAKIEGKYTTSSFLNSFNVGSKTLYSHTQNKYLIDRLRNLKGSKTLRETLRNNPYAANSIFLKRLDNPDFDFDHSVLSLETIRYHRKKTRGRHIQDMEEVGHEEVKVNMFVNKNNDKAYYFYPTTSDKKNVNLIYTDKFKVTYNPKSGKISGRTLDGLVNKLVKPDFDRIIQSQNRENKTGIKSYDKGSRLFYGIPALNDLLLDEDGYLDIKLYESRYDDIKKEVARVAERLINENIAYWNDNNIRIDGGPKGLELNKLAAEYTLNYLIFNAEMQQLFVKDPALYYKQAEVNKKLEKGKPYNYNADVIETFVNVGKRLAKDVAPGEAPASGIKDKFNLAILTDRESKSLAYDYYKTLNLFGVEDYSQIEGTDAQEFTTLEEHINTMYMYGKLSKENYDTILAKYRAGENLNQAELELVLQPLKPVYVHDRFDFDNNVDSILYVKSSSFPLIPQLTQNLEIDKLRKTMENDGIDRVAFDTAVKVGGPAQSVNIWKMRNKYSKEVIEDADFKNLSVEEQKENYEQSTVIKENINLNPSTYFNVSRKGFKIQQEVPYDPNKQSIKRGTQESKLLFNNILGLKGFKYKGNKYEGQDLQQVYLDNYKTIFDENYNELVEELGPPENINVPRLKSLLQKEAIERGYPINDISGVEVVDGQFKVPLWGTTMHLKYESLLNSIVKNRILSIKFPGKSFVLGSEEGFQFDKKKIATLDDITDKTGIKFTKSFTGELKRNQVILPWKFIDNNGKKLNIKEFVGEDGYVDTNKLPKELLTMFGFRIPTQGHNSMSKLEVVGFLPEKYGDLTIATRDFVTQMGSDFDIDKLYTYRYHYYYNSSEGKLNIIDDKFEESSNNAINNLQNKYKDVADLNEDNIRQAVNSFRNYIDEKRTEQVELADYLKTKDLSYQERKYILNEVGISIAEHSNEVLTDLYELIDLYTARHDLTRKVAQNNIMDVHMSVMDHPEVQSQVYEPLAFGYFKTGNYKHSNERFEEAVNEAGGISEYLKNIFEEGKEVIPFSDKYQKQKYIEATAGKAGVGVKSLDSVFNALTQSSGLTAVQGDGVLQITLGKYTAYGNELSNPYTVNSKNKSNKRYKSDVIAAYQSAAVDNEKERILGYVNSNTFTFPAERMMAALGFEEDMIAGIMSQPIVKELQKRTEELIRDGFYRENAYEKAVLSLLPKGEIDLSESSKLTEDALFSMIKHGEKVPGFQKMQDLVLENFVTLISYGKEMGVLENAMNLDSSGIGKTFLETLQKDQSIKDSLFSGKFANVGSLLGDIKDAKSLDELDAEEQQNYTEISKGIFLKPNSIPGFAYVQGLKTDIKYWDKYFLYNKPHFQTVLKRLPELSNKQIQSVYDAYKHALYQWTLKDAIDPREASKDLFINEEDKPALGNYLKEQIEKYKVLQNNPFINKLYFEADRYNSSLININFGDSSADNLFNLDIYQGFIDLVNNDYLLEDRNGEEYGTADLADDLFVYSIMKGQTDFINGFMEYIPYEFLENNGFSEMLRDLNKTLNTIEQGELFDPELFAIQYMQNNSYLAANYSEYDGHFELRGNDLVATTGEYSFTLGGLYNYKDQLFYGVDTSKAVRIPKKGAKNFTEVYFDEEWLVSNLPKNNVGVRKIETRNQHKKNQNKNRGTYTPSTKPSLNHKYGLVGPTMDFAILNDTMKVFEQENRTNDLRYFMLDHIRNNVNNYNLQVEIINDPNADFEGMYEDGVITFNTYHLNQTNIERVITEEFVHAVTQESIENPTTDEQKAAVDRMYKLMNIVRHRLDKKNGKGSFEAFVKNFEDTGRLRKGEREFYNVYNVREMVAAIINDPDLQNEIKDVNLWDRFVSEILNVLKSFGIDLTDNKALANTVSDILTLSKPSEGDISVHDLSPTIDEAFDTEDINKTFEYYKENCK